jgi:hypothetical protein
MPYHIAQSVPMVIYKIKDFSPPYYKGYLSLNFDVLADVDLPEPAAVEGIYNNASEGVEDGKIDIRSSNYTYNPEVIMQLRIGDYYWNGSGWNTYPITFQVKIGQNEDNVFRKILTPRDYGFYVNGS